MESNSINSRYDFVYLFDVKDGNPNGDPDMDNQPRTDAETQMGLVTDVCIKRKVRNYVMVKYHNEAPYDIFIRQGNILNTIIDSAKGEDIPAKQMDMCKRYYDVRTFGAVMSTGKAGAGVVRGPVQFTFARSVDPVFGSDYSITRCAVTTDAEAKSQEGREFASTFGKKSAIHYGLYRMHGFISAIDAQAFGFTETDLDLLWEALLNAFEFDRSAARGEMNPRALIVFKHASPMGNARSGELFDKVKVVSNTPTPRSWDDYTVTIDENMPKDVTLIRKL